MSARVIIVEGVNVYRVAAALEALHYSNRPVITEVAVVEAATYADSTNTCEMIEFKREVQDFYYVDLFSDRKTSLAGIEELRTWLENGIRHTLQRFSPGSRRQHRIPIFQPCWSSRRFKSLT